MLCQNSETSRVKFLALTPSSRPKFRDRFGDRYPYKMSTKVRLRFAPSPLDCLIFAGKMLEIFM